MTETTDAVITEAVSVIDKALSKMLESRAGLLRRGHRRPARRPLPAHRPGIDGELNRVGTGLAAAGALRAGAGEQGGEGRLQAVTEQCGVGDRGRIAVQPDVQAPVVAQQGGVERHTHQ